MAKQNHEEIKKGLGDRIQELLQSLQIIRDSLEAVKQNRNHQIIPLYGQLRALLTDQSKKKKNKPLLLDLAEATGYPLNVYNNAEAWDLPKELGEPLFHIGGLPLTIKPQIKGQQSTPLQKFLAQPILIYKNRSYSTARIIDFFANKAGGAHYATHIPKDLAEVLSVALNGEPVLVNALLQIAGAIYKLGVHLVKEHVDFDMHLLVIVPEQKLEKVAYILKHKYPQSSMQIFCRIEPGMRLVFGAGAIQGFGALVRVEQLLDWTKPLYLILSLEIQEDLSTVMTVRLDGEIVGVNKIPFPLFVVGNSMPYKSYLNRSDEDSEAGLNFGFSEMLLFKAVQPMRNRLRLFDYFDGLVNRDTIRTIHFKKGKYGYAAPNTNELKMTGKPKEVTLKKAAGFALPKK